MHEKVLVKMVPIILTEKKYQHAEVCPDFMRELLNSVLCKIIAGKIRGAFIVTQSKFQGMLSKHCHLQDPKKLT
jgi:hypothetical protein